MSLSALAEHIENVPLVDHHVHGCWLQAPDRAQFENGLNEANTQPLAGFDSAFDTQLGFAVRAYCSPTLVLLALDWADEDRDFLGFGMERTPARGTRQS